MSSYINTNTTANEANYNLGINQANEQKNIQRLSSGLRINSAADDASGLVISESLRAQSAGLTQATRNTNDAINVVKTAEGALNEVHSLLINIRSLVVHAANVGANDPTALKADQDAIAAAVKSINRIAGTTQFNNKNLLDGSASSGSAAITAGSASTTPTNSQVATLGVISDANTYGTAPLSNASVTYNASKSASYTVNGDGADSLTSASTFTGSLKVNGTTINLGSTPQTLDQVNSALEATGSTYQATVSNGALKLTDSKSGVSAGATSFDVTSLSYATTAAPQTFNKVSGGTLAEGNIASVSVTKTDAAGVKTAYTSDQVATASDGTSTYGFTSGTLKGLQLSSNANTTSLPVVTGTGTATTAGSFGLAKVSDAKAYGATAIASGNVTYAAATASTLTSSTNTGAVTGDTFGGSLKVNGNTISLTGTTNTLANVNSAIQAASGNANVVATIVSNKLVLTDSTGAPVTADVTGLNDTTTTHNFAQTATTSTDGVAQSITVNGQKSTSSAVSGANTVFSFAGGSLDGLALSATTANLAPGTLGTFAATKDAQPAAIGSVSSTADKVTAGNSLEFQVGANAGQTVAISIGSAKATSLGSYTDTATSKSFNLSDLLSGGGLNVTDITGAAQQDALKVVDQAISDVSTTREQLGALQSNVLESNVRSLGTAQQNTDASESSIRDTNLSSEIVDFTKNQILVQAGTSALAQANQAPQAILKLLQ